LPCSYRAGVSQQSVGLVGTVRGGSPRVAINASGTSAACRMLGMGWVLANQVVVVPRASRVLGAKPKDAVTRICVDRSRVLRVAKRRVRA